MAAKEEDEYIIESLMRKGLDRSYATSILANVRNDRSDRKQFYKHLFSGIFVFLAGAAMTWKSYSMAKSGELFAVFMGIMIYGIFSITRGIILFRK